MDSMLPSGEGNYAAGASGLAREKLLVASRPSPQYSRSPATIVWNKGGFEGISTKDAVISLSLLSLEYWELIFSFPEAAWTLEALEIAKSLLLLCFSSLRVAQWL